MKLSDKTINILKNFTTINPSLHVKSGNLISTISIHKTIMAKARVEETFDTPFTIFELSKFLGVISLFNDPDFEFKDKQVKISSGKQYINYTYADPSMVVVPPDKDIELPTTDVEFDITNSDLTRLLRSVSVLQLPEIAVVGEEGKIFVKAVNSKDISKDSFAVEVGDTNQNFKFYIKNENLKLINTDYNVKITSRGLAQFNSPEVTYWIAVESNSSFDN